MSDEACPPESVRFLPFSPPCSQEDLEELLSDVHRTAGLREEGSRGRAGVCVLLARLHSTEAGGVGM